ncbi:hypothetical protein FZC84_19385 [Rossellomorea vietnamensis]|uniref:Uncharacterized protein n=1 Tax=Rossellomorea vietnamensis TaxID=218284 RepID=A0A5D4M721_9BACI|nr:MULTISPECIES: hypothetical protein [Bacillaceae]TYR97396.1 hypothetical protein FZC84_19385 [Rossellomorea vietnamensis]
MSIHKSWMKVNTALMVSTVPAVVQRIVWNRYHLMKNQFVIGESIEYYFKMEEIDGESLYCSSIIPA